MQKKGKDKRYKKRLLKAFIWLFVLLLSIYIGYDNSIKNIGFSPHQPVAFSHKTHSGDYGLKCLFCHSSAEYSTFSPIPTTKACLVCHVALKNQTELMKGVNASFDNNIPIRYNRVYQLPDYVRFNHSRHIRAQIDCSSCHGEVEKMDTVYQAKPLTMGWCLDCHRQPEKYIVFARDISGILRITGQSGLQIENSSDIVSPSYGMWASILPKDIYRDFYLPKNPARGPETCSACHF